VFPNFQQANPAITLLDGATPVAMDFTGLSGNAALDSLDAASALVMTLDISNDYVIDPDINALTDWVLTMPTKQAYTAPVFDASGNLTDAREPFTNRWDDSGACEAIAVGQWNREESAVLVDPDEPTFSPQPPAAGPGPDFQICTEASVISFGEGLLSAPARTFCTALARKQTKVGHASALTMAPTSLLADDGRRFLTDGTTTVFGLPVVGFAVQKYQNGDLGGVVANYAAAVEHKAVLSIQ
jgi:hypothetical protein